MTWLDCCHLNPHLLSENSILCLVNPWTSQPLTRRPGHRQQSPVQSKWSLSQVLSRVYPDQVWSSKSPRLKNNSENWLCLFNSFSLEAKSSLTGKITCNLPNCTPTGFSLAMDSLSNNYHLTRSNCTLLSVFIWNYDSKYRGSSAGGVHIWEEKKGQCLQQILYETENSLDSFHFTFLTHKSSYLHYILQELQISMS